MSKKKQLTISEFARLTGIKRDNLRFYDRIGLLSPEYRGENKYRYYSRYQLNTAYLISGLRGIGVPIEDIKKFESFQSAKDSLALFAQQEQHIQKEIDRLKEIKKIMKLYTEMMEETLSHEGEGVFLQTKKQETIFLCPPIPQDMNEDEASIFSYEYAEANGVDLGYPIGNIVEESNIEEYLQHGVARYYFKTSQPCNAYKLEGLYAVVYGGGNIEDIRSLHSRLLSFVKEHNLIICSAIYEEYPLHDISIHAKEHYGIRLEVQVKENTKKADSI